MKRIFKLVLMFTCLSGLFVVINSGNSASASSTASSADLSRNIGDSYITVTNKTKSTVEVSVNRWSGFGGNTSYYKIKPDGTESWHRFDERGVFLLAIKRNGQVERYIVQKGDLINVVDYKNEIGIHSKISGPQKSDLTTTTTYSTKDDEIIFINLSTDICYVAVNTWGNGSSDFYEVAPLKVEKWSRSDMRGVVLYLLSLYEGKYYSQYQLAMPGDTIIYF